MSRPLHQSLYDVLNQFEHADVVKAILRYELGVHDEDELHRIYYQYMNRDDLNSFLHDEIK